MSELLTRVILTQLDGISGSYNSPELRPGAEFKGEVLAMSTHLANPGSIPASSIQESGAARFALSPYSATTSPLRPFQP